MYAYIKGELAEINTDHIVVEAGGIGYQVFISLQTFDYLPSVGEDLKIYTYLYLREDAMILYGFLTKDDLELFKLLISVSGIGPKGGLAILSTLEADDLRFAILSGDAKAISKAPGVGGKTAQRVILELKDKVAFAAADDVEEILTLDLEGPTGDDMMSEAQAALVALGYSQAEIAPVLKKATKCKTTEEVIKLALKQLNKF